MHLWLRPEPFVLGTLLGFVSAVGYTGANIFLRALTHCDPIWVSCIKAFPTVVLVSPWLVGRAVRGQVISPSLKLLWLLVLAGVLGQLGGNVLFQWSLGVVGMALSVPLTLGAMILTGTLLGRYFLREHVSRQMAWAIFTLILAIFILGFGARAANLAIVETGIDEFTAGGLAYLAAGVMAACTSGVVYCILGAAIRHASTNGMPLSTILVTVSVVGMLCLGGLSYLRMGAAAIWNTNSNDMALMLMAGICNAAAFWSLSKALHLTGLVYVNALNASQIAMATVAGVVFFDEAFTFSMFAGVVLTMVGLLLMKNERHVRDTARADTVQTGARDLHCGDVAPPVPVEGPTK